MTKPTMYQLMTVQELKKAEREAARSMKRYLKLDYQGLWAQERNNWIDVRQEMAIRKNYKLLEVNDVMNEKPETPFEYYPYASYVKGRKTRGVSDEWKLHKTLSHAKNAVTGGRLVGRPAAGEIYSWNRESEDWTLEFALSPGDEIPWQMQ